MKAAAVVSTSMFLLVLNLLLAIPLDKPGPITFCSPRSNMRSATLKGLEIVIRHVLAPPSWVRAIRRFKDLHPATSKLLRASMRRRLLEAGVAVEILVAEVVVHLAQTIGAPGESITMKAT
jgi:hypothetical protein